jgi:predicted MFS family arabinose efflux permease
VTGRTAGLGRLGPLAAVAVIVEAALYSAVAPLLPHYRDELGLSKAAAGVLTGSYTAGMVVGSIAGAVAAGRLGPRSTVIGGFGLFAASTVVFGAAGSVEVLDVSRATQGFAAGLIWSGILAWLIAMAPENRRGQVIGNVLGAAIFGTMLGPVLGTIAVAVGPTVAFSGVAGCALGIAAWTLRVPAPARTPDVRTDWRRVLRDRRLVALTVLSLLPGIVIGATNALVPLRLDGGGFSELAVGATFLVASLLAAVTSPTVGRLSDRIGRRPLILLGLGTAAPTLVALGLVDTPWPVAVLTAVAFGAAVTTFTVPLMAELSEGAEAAGLAVGPAAALLNLTFAGGETLGAPLGAIGADLTSDGAPFVVLGLVAAAAAATVATKSRIGLAPSAYRP